jgi:hypothetical protein
MIAAINYPSIHIFRAATLQRRQRAFRVKRVAAKGRAFARPKGTWYGFPRANLKPHNWSVLGDPSA